MSTYINKTMVLKSFLYSIIMFYCLFNVDIFFKLFTHKKNTSFDFELCLTCVRLFERKSTISSLKKFCS